MRSHRGPRTHQIGSLSLDGTLTARRAGRRSRNLWRFEKKCRINPGELDIIPNCINTLDVQKRIRSIQVREFLRMNDPHVRPDRLTPIVQPIRERISVYLWAVCAAPTVWVGGWVIGTMVELIGGDGAFAFTLFNALYGLEFAAALLFFWFALVALSQPLPFLRPAVISVATPCHDAITAVLGALVGVSVILAVATFDWRYPIMPITFVAGFEILIAVLRLESRSLSPEGPAFAWVTGLCAGAAAILVASGIWQQ